MARACKATSQFRYTMYSPAPLRQVLTWGSLPCRLCARCQAAYWLRSWCRQWPGWGRRGWPCCRCRRGTFWTFCPSQCRPRMLVAWCEGSVTRVSAGCTAPGHARCLCALDVSACSSRPQVLCGCKPRASPTPPAHTAYFSSAQGGHNAPGRPHAHVLRRGRCLLPKPAALPPKAALGRSASGQTCRGNCGRRSAMPTENPGENRSGVQLPRKLVTYAIWYQ